MSEVLGRDVGAGQGAGEPGIFVGRSCGWTEGLDEESRERCGWMGGGTEGLPWGERGAAWERASV